MNRNPSIEFFRILLMLGFCILHAMTMCAHGPGPICGRLTYVLYSCVVGFVFISGWFGVDFEFRKLLRLWGVAFYAAAVLCHLSISASPFAFGLAAMAFLIMKGVCIPFGPSWIRADGEDGKYAMLDRCSHGTFTSADFWSRFCCVFPSGLPATDSPCGHLVGEG